MTRVILHITFLLSFFVGATQAKFNDGPYVFYKNGFIYLESIVNGEWKRDSVKKETKGKLQLRLLLPDRPGEAITFPLKKKLEEEPSEYPEVANLLVVSDIEGTFQGFTGLLRAGKVIDDKYNWIFDKGHLVICGDLFDRGNEVTACLWLLYKLEDEAKAKGGYVHVVLGNHEIMNLSEDIRYVNTKYLESATLMNKTYMEFYAPGTELGQWLRTKNVMERVGSLLFLHGGVSQAVNENDLSLKKMNNRLRSFYDKDGYDSLIRQANLSVYFNGASSPFWYRGYLADPLASQAQVDSTLKIFGVQHIVVGHTIVDSIKSLYGGKVIAIDVNHHQGNHQALLVEKNIFYRINAEGKKTELFE